MGTVDYIILAVIALIAGLAIWAVVRSKKSGKKCIGCPDSCACSAGNCGGGCSGCKK
jgi:hypothetical protein